MNLINALAVGIFKEKINKHDLEEDWTEWI